TRDMEFAQKFKLKVSNAPLVSFDEGIKKGGGEKTTHYHLRDWLISRQRYWGPPIPIIYCKSCGTVPVPEKDLPVLLPYVKEFRPTGTGKSPLASVASFVKTKCPQCKGPAEREADVSDTFLDSAWYYLRYPSVGIQNSKIKMQNDKSKSKIIELPWDIKVTKKWLPVDMYIGGQEHAVLHLLYTRFIAMALKNLGFIGFEEPFKKFRAHGLLTNDGAKMSKSKGNVVNPDEYFKKYGADTVRMYLMFLGPFSEGGDWSDKGIVGIYRFLNRVWQFVQESKIRPVIRRGAPSDDGAKSETNSKLESLKHKTIKKVTEDLENLRYNTAIAALMEYLNAMSNDEFLISKKSIETLLALLAPFAPHITEELWHSLGYKDSVHNQPWPKYDSKLTQEEKIRLVVQVNGKVRDIVEASRDVSEKEAEKLALGSKKIQKWLENKKLKRIIFVPGRLINIVV
ncbi:MAG: leucyl-tRNA synthetase, partial [Parcubacteria group bacterium Greene1014_47]